MGRVRAGEFSGCFCLVAPEIEDRWIVYVSDDPDVVSREGARVTDWGFLDTPSLQTALDGLRVEWLDPSVDAAEEACVFDLRRGWRRRRHPWWRRWRPDVRRRLGTGRGPTRCPPSMWRPSSAGTAGSRSDRRGTRATHAIVASTVAHDLPRLLGRRREAAGRPRRLAGGQRLMWVTPDGVAHTVALPDWRTVVDVRGAGGPVPDAVRSVLEEVADEVYGGIASGRIPPGGREAGLPESPYTVPWDVVVDPERLRRWLLDVDLLWRLDVVDALGECLDEIEDG